MVDVVDLLVTRSRRYYNFSLLAGWVKGWSDTLKEHRRLRCWCSICDYEALRTNWVMHVLNNSTSFSDDR